MEFEKYEVGGILEKAVGKTEGAYIDVDDAGMQIIILFDGPKPEEIAQFEQEKPFEIRFVTLSDIMMFTLKIGNLNWMDAPYSPHLSLGLTKDFEEIKPGEGLAAMLILADARNAKIKSMRLLGLSEKFSKEFVSEARRLKDKVFVKSQYDYALQNLYRKYETKEIVKLSDIRCKM